MHNKQIIDESKTKQKMTNPSVAIVEFEFKNVIDYGF